VTVSEGIAERVRVVYDTGDVTGLRDLLADDVRWGDDDHPSRCRSRDDVLRTFSGWLGQGVTATVRDARTGPRGVALRLDVAWTDPSDRPRGTEFFHVLMLRDGLIAEVRRFNDVRSAHAVISG
jgi:ketosteroid isomerase-like protein